MVIFLWALILVVLTPVMGSAIPAGVGALILSIFHPPSLIRFLRFRCILLLSTIFALNVGFGGGNVDMDLFGMMISTANIIAGIQMVLSAALVMLAADLLSSYVDISEVAGLFERLGMRGLGFAIGVAVNFLPNLRQSSANAWQSLRMRGGFRAKRVTAAKFLFVTILANSLRHSEEIVLAAETRAYNPENSSAAEIKIGQVDWWLVPISVLSLTTIFLVCHGF